MTRTANKLNSESLVVSATFTIEPIEEPLKFWFKLLNLPCNIEVAPYNQVFQQLLDPNSFVRNNTTGFNVIYFSWDDFLLQHKPTALHQDKDLTREAENLSSTLADAVIKAVQGGSATFIIYLLPLRQPDSAYGIKRSMFQERETYLVDALKDVPGVFVFRASEYEGIYPVEEKLDPISDRFGHVPFTQDYYTALACHTVRTLLSIRSTEKKVIILDCDNTLWDGVVGETGVDGIIIDPHFRALQEFMIGQAKLGRLLCLCSKNVEEDVLNVLDNRPDMVLQRQHLVSWRINWQPKSSNLIELAEELQLGLDSFIFIDDNPVECAEVRSGCPEVLTLQLPKVKEMFDGFLKHAWCFDKSKTTEVDSLRTKSYQENVHRRKFQKQASSFTNFLKELKLDINISPLKLENVPRVAQLTQRTNQFNSTTIRMNEGEVEDWLSNQNSSCYVVHVSDRFGDYGLVGVLMVHYRETSCFIESMILSCRTLGKGVEHKMIAAMAQLAAEKNVDKISIPFIKTARNQPILIFLQSLKGTESAEDNKRVFHFDTTYASSIKFTPDESSTLSHQGNKAKRTDDRFEGSDSNPWNLNYDQIKYIQDNLATVSQIQQSIDEAVRKRPDLKTVLAAPQGEMEKTLAAIWQEVLKVEGIGRFDHFIDLGGTSIHLVRIHSLIARKIGEELPIAHLFQYVTIQSLAEHIASLRNEGKPKINMVRKRARLQRESIRKLAVKRRA